jgi:hypothetical protein
VVLYRAVYRLITWPKQTTITYDDDQGHVNQAASCRVLLCILFRSNFLEGMELPIKLADIDRWWKPDPSTGCEIMVMLVGGNSDPILLQESL